MYKIQTISGELVGMTDVPIYIKRSEDTNCYIPANIYDAIGITFNNKTYNIVGHTDIENAETVTVSYVDGGGELHDMLSTLETLLGISR